MSVASRWACLALQKQEHDASRSLGCSSEVLARKVAGFNSIGVVIFTG